MQWSQLMALASKGDTSTVKFFGQMTSVDDLGPYLVGFGNATGGQIIVGIDVKNFHLLGTDLSKSWLDKLIQENCYPLIPVSLEIVERGDKKIAIISVDNTHQKPFYFQKRCYVIQENQPHLVLQEVETGQHIPDPHPEENADVEAVTEIVSVKEEPLPVIIEKHEEVIPEPEPEIVAEADIEPETQPEPELMHTSEAQPDSEISEEVIKESSAYQPEFIDEIDLIPEPVKEEGQQNEAQDIVAEEKPNHPIEIIETEDKEDPDPIVASQFEDDISTLVTFHSKEEKPKQPEFTDAYNVPETPEMIEEPKASIDPEPSRLQEAFLFPDDLQEESHETVQFPQEIHKTIPFKSATMAAPLSSLAPVQEEDRPLTKRQEKALKFLLHNETIKNKEYRELYKVSHKTAHIELVDLMDRGLLIQQGAGRSTCYLLKNPGSVQV